MGLIIIIIWDNCANSPLGLRYIPTLCTH